MTDKEGPMKTEEIREWAEAFVEKHIRATRDAIFEIRVQEVELYTEAFCSELAALEQQHEQDQRQIVVKDEALREIHTRSLDSKSDYKPYTLLMELGEIAKAALTTADSGKVLVEKKKMLEIWDVFDGLEEGYINENGIAQARSIARWLSTLLDS